MGTRTPWGTSDHQKSYARGITFYGTPRHGGFRVSDGRLAEMPEALRNFKSTRPGWYEEDVEWCIVACAFPQFFAKEVDHARQTMRDYYPDTYEAWTGETIPVEQSRVKRERADAAKHANDWVAISAFGDWHEKVPAGMVGVCCTKGAQRKTGRMVNGQVVWNDAPEERFFLVPEADYNDSARRSAIGFVVSGNYQEIEAFR